MTTAERIAAALGDDGQTWQTEDGQTLDDLAREAGARQEHAEVGYDDDGEWIVRRIDAHEQHTGSAVRYLFPDGSAIVNTPAWWCIEGSEPFSCADLEVVFCADTGGEVKVTEIALRRDGDRDLEFRGMLLGEGCIGTDGKSYNDSTRGTDVKIYRTEAGSYLASVVQWSAWDGERDIYRVLRPAAGPEELLALLKEDAGGELGRASKEAWEEAASVDPEIAAQRNERVA